MRFSGTSDFPAQENSVIWEMERTGFPMFLRKGIFLAQENYGFQEKSY
jgi:hypothetical protein